MALDFESLKKAITALDGILSKTTDAEFMQTLDDITKNGLRAGAIQTFEFTYELSWKFIKRWLDINLGSVYVDGVSCRELFRIAAEHRLIDDVDAWMVFHRGRNLTSHTYNAEIADEVYTITVSFLPFSKQLLHNLEMRND